MGGYPDFQGKFKAFLSRQLGLKMEDRRLVIMQRLIFLLICTLLLLKPTANAIFLHTLGVENLPIAYVFVALLAFLITTVYSRFIAKYSTIDLFIRSTWICIGFLFIIGVLLWMDVTKAIAAALFYLFISIFGILTASQFWIIANKIFNAREARKHFGFIGSGAIAGGIAGGYLASLISTFTQTEAIPFFAIFFIFLSIRLVNKLRPYYQFEESDTPNEKLETKVTQPLHLVKNFKHLRYLALTVTLSVFTAKMIDYQFGYFASRAFTNEEDLASYYGFWYSTFNFVSLLVQLILTTRVVGKLGVGRSLLILPILLTINSVLLLFLPLLGLATLLKLTDGGMKQSINKAAMELIMLPIPEDIKARTKTFLDVFVDSAATGFSGIVLIFVIKAFQLPNFLVTAIIVVGCIAWLFIANNIRKEYKTVFRRSLKMRSRQNEEVEDVSIIANYKKILSEGDQFQIIKALSQLKSHHMKGLEEEIKILLHSNDPPVISSVIDAILYNNLDFSDDVLPLLRHDNQAIKVSAIEYLINHQDKLDPNFLIQLINDKDPHTRMAALIGYSKEYQNNPTVLKVLRVEDRLKEILKNNLEDMVDLEIVGVLKIISYGKFVRMYSVIEYLMGSDKKYLSDQAIMAAGETRSTKFYRILIKLLDLELPPKSTQTALTKFGSKRISNTVTGLLQKEALPALRNISCVLEKLPDQLSVASLLELAEHEDIIVKNNAIRALSQLKDVYPLLTIDENRINRLLLNEASYSNTILNVLDPGNDVINLSIDNNLIKQQLISALTHRIDLNLKTIFELLNIKFPPENFLELYNYMKGSDQTLRNNAIEYLDNTLHKNLKEILIPLLEFNILQLSNQQIAPAKMDNDPDYLRSFLVNNRDEQIRTAAIDYFNNSKSNS